MPPRVVVVRPMIDKEVNERGVELSPPHRHYRDGELVRGFWVWYCYRTPIYDLLRIKL